VGATPDVAIVMNLHLESGRWINEADHTHSTNVVVLGHDTADTIFPANVSPVDKEVEIEGQPFRVIGVLEKRKDSLQGGANPNDNVAEMPVGTFWRLHPEQKDFMFAVKTYTQEDLPRAIDDIEALLRIRRGVPPDKDDDFAIYTQDTFTDLWRQISGGIFTVMLAISSIALVVGGVGVMNIMLVSVTERTREIGIRMAIGARRIHVLLQFLVEAVLLSVIGGGTGIVTGSVVSRVISAVAGWPTLVSTSSMAGAFVFSAAVGVFFGYYPARRASLLNPIEALRYE